MNTQSLKEQTEQADLDSTNAKEYKNPEECDNFLKCATSILENKSVFTRLKFDPRPEIVPEQFIILSKFNNSGIRDVYSVTKKGTRELLKYECRPELAVIRHLYQKVTTPGKTHTEEATVDIIKREMIKEVDEMLCEKLNEYGNNIQVSTKEILEKTEFAKLKKSLDMQLSSGDY